MTPVHRCTLASLAGEEGQDLLEHGLLTSFISVTLFALLPVVANLLAVIFSSIVSAIP